MGTLVLGNKCAEVYSGIEWISMASMGFLVQVRS